ncbi:hypothetical protein EYC80_008866 [Monilinia laxa]|uniref:Uncharacterized protein n=1 Tax=Monilinia laxa TaxID=61186 RepID=A0A5N6K240_MONLA|nr:hypothetical protein EYC80_008866 [Monilinia laxa]
MLYHAINHKAPKMISRSYPASSMHFDSVAICQLTRITLIRSDLDQQRQTLPVPIIPISFPCPSSIPPSHLTLYLIPKQIKQSKV